jgi:hypothetical protein
MNFAMYATWFIGPPLADEGRMRLPAEFVLGAILYDEFSRQYRICREVFSNRAA